MRRILRALLAVVSIGAFSAYPQTQNQKTPQPQAPASNGSLAVQAGVDGVLFIDGQRRAAVSAGRVLVLKLIPGEHIVEFQDAKGNSLWNDTVTIPRGEQVVWKISTGDTAPVRVTPQNSAQGTAIARNVFAQPFEEFFPERKVSEFWLSSNENGHLKGYTLEEQLKDCETPTVMSADTCKVYTFYGYGKYDEALGESNREIERTNKDLLMWSEATHNQVWWSDDELICAYARRAAIKHVLSDDNGALTDLNSALVYVSQEREHATDLKHNEDNYEHLVHVFRAITLAALRHYEEAMSELNNSAGQGSRIADEASPRLRREIQAAMKLDSGIAAPATPPLKASTGQDGGITNEIDALLRSGRYSPLPEAQCSGSGSGLLNLSVENSTAYQLTVHMNGPEDRTISIAPGASQKFTLTPGSYRVIGRVNAADVLPFYGTNTYPGSGSCQERFYIQ